jgi:protein-tyrosine phosphatase
MVTLIPKATDAIRAALERGENVLVHCHAGAQRSATVVVNYLIQYGHFVVNRDFNTLAENQKKQMLYNSSVNYLVFKRPFVYYGGLNNNFRYALENILGTPLSTP